VRPRVLPEGEAEILHATLWYEDRQEGLGERFYNEVSATIQAIGKSPLRFPLYEAAQLRLPVRRARVGRFPYYVIYLDDAHNAGPLVIAVIHASPRPAYWADRL
jgi:toxin ParE1/3/4